jgi:hypothetical protein
MARPPRKQVLTLPDNGDSYQAFVELRNSGLIGR